MPKKPKKIKRKWEWIHDNLHHVVSHPASLEHLKGLAKSIDNAMVEAYPHAPTTKDWEDDYDNIVVADLVTIVVGSKSYCVGCEMIEAVFLTVRSGFAESHCSQCRYGKIAGQCIEPNSSSLFNQFDDLLEEAIGSQGEWIDDD